MAKVLVLTIETRDVGDVPSEVLCTLEAPVDRKKMEKSPKMQQSFLYYLGRPIIRMVCKNPDIERVVVV